MIHQNIHRCAPAGIRRSKEKVSAPIGERVNGQVKILDRSPGPVSLPLAISGPFTMHHHGDKNPEKGRFRLLVCHDLLIFHDGRILPYSN